MTRLSIIIVNWNTKKLLMQCIKSLTQISNLKSQSQNSKLKTEYEIIVVDNGSIDGSVDEVQSSKFKAPYQTVQGKVQSDSLKLKVIENESNLGFSKAVNQGIKESTGEVVLLLNSDTIVKKGALKELLDFEEKVGSVVVGARMLNPDGTVQGSCFYFPTVKRAILEYWLKKKNYFSKYALAGLDSVEVEAVSGGAMLISRVLIDKIGMLDERYFMYFEDLDFCRRVRKAGYKIYYLPTAEIIHEHGASGKTLVDPADQWKRLIPSSKIYHGWLKHYLISFILWSGQKCLKRKKQ